MARPARPWWETVGARPGSRHDWPTFLGLVLFLVIGYCLQATIWERGWTMDEVMWQHWMVKPVCLIIVCFPVTAAALWIGDVSIKASRAPVIGLLGAVPSGLLYLAATAVLN